MRLTENNSKYAVIRTAFHGGGTISFHNSLNAAIRSKNANSSKTCDCGCCGIVAVTEDARDEAYNNNVLDTMKLYYEIPEYTGNEHYSRLRR